MRLTPKIAFLVLMFVVFILPGCMSPRGWRYSPDTYPTVQQPVLSKAVAVPPFRDARPNENNDSMLMRLIPLMPFGWTDLSTPEAGSPKIASTAVWQFKPVEDLAKAAAEELQASGLFKEVFFTQRPSEGELLLRGDIQSTRYSGKIFSYGLSVYGALLWALGLPAGTIHNELTVTLDLEDRTTGKVLYHKAYTRNFDEAPFWIYSTPSDFNYDVMFKEMLRDMVSNLRLGLTASSPTTSP